MVELVDTQDLESCEETRAGSIPVIRTNIIENAPLFWTRIGTKNGTSPDFPSKKTEGFIFISYLYPLSIY